MAQLGFMCLCVGVWFIVADTDFPLELSCSKLTYCILVLWLCNQLLVQSGKHQFFLGGLNNFMCCIKGHDVTSLQIQSSSSKEGEEKEGEDSIFHLNSLVIREIICCSFLSHPPPPIPTLISTLCIPAWLSLNYRYCIALFIKVKHDIELWLLVNKGNISKY